MVHTLISILFLSVSDLIVPVEGAEHDTLYNHETKLEVTNAASAIESLRNLESLWNILDPDPGAVFSDLNIKKGALTKTGEHSFQGTMNLDGSVVGLGEIHWVSQFRVKMVATQTANGPGTRYEVSFAGSSDEIYRRVEGAIIELNAIDDTHVGIRSKVLEGSDLVSSASPVMDRVAKELLPIAMDWVVIPKAMDLFSEQASSNGEIQ